MTTREIISFHHGLSNCLLLPLFLCIFKIVVNGPKYTRLFPVVWLLFIYVLRIHSQDGVLTFYGLARSSQLLMILWINEYYHFIFVMKFCCIQDWIKILCVVLFVFVHVWIDSKFDEITIETLMCNFLWNHGGPDIHRDSTKQNFTLIKFWINCILFFILRLPSS